MAPTKVPAVRLKYTNRKSNGLKLASIVSKDIRKHCATFDKKTKTTTNDSASLELDLEHKEQDDDCIQEIVATLKDALRARDGISPLRLEELSLQNNNLTTTSLRLLAQVIHAARFDLRDVDLSQNKIKVITRKEAGEWATFLRAFGGCELMRRLNLSGNDFSGSLPMEIFLREYCEQQTVDPSLLYYQNGSGEAEANYEVLSEKTNDLHISPRTHANSGASADLGDTNTSLVNAKVLQRRRGIRAIPYIILKDAQLDDLGALHLSYVLEHHYWPQYLMTRLKDGSKEAKRKEDDDLGGAFGLVFSGNNLLTTSGSKLLDFANAARAELVGHHALTQNLESSWVDAAKDDGPIFPRSRKMSIQSLSDDSGDRRISTPSTTIDSLRMRLQRMALEKANVYGVQLWHAAFKVLYVARVVLSRLRLRPSTTTTKTSKSMVIPNVSRQSNVLLAKKTMKVTPPTTTQFGKRGIATVTKQPSLLRSVTNGQRKTTKLLPLIKIEKHFETDVHNPMRLPTRLWVKIFVEYAEAVGILNDHQVDKIVQYARNRSNLAGEQHSQAKGESHQAWHVLEQINCFTYELKMANE